MSNQCHYQGELPAPLVLVSPLSSAASAPSREEGGIGLGTKGGGGAGGPEGAGRGGTQSIVGTFRLPVEQLPKRANHGCSYPCIECVRVCAIDGRVMMHGS